MAQSAECRVDAEGPRVDLSIPYKPSVVISTVTPVSQMTCMLTAVFLKDRCVIFVFALFLPVYSSHILSSWKFSHCGSNKLQIRFLNMLLIHGDGECFKIMGLIHSGFFFYFLILLIYSLIIAHVYNVLKSFFKCVWIVFIYFLFCESCFRE